MARSPERWVMVGTGLVLAMLLAVVAFSYRAPGGWTIVGAASARELELHSELVQLRSVAIAVESSARSFVIGGEGNDLQRYRAQRSLVDPQMKRVTDVFPTDIDGQKRLRKLRSDIDQFVRQINTQVSIRSQDGFRAAYSHDRAGSARRAMDAVVRDVTNLDPLSPGRMPVRPGVLGLIPRAINPTLATLLAVLLLAVAVVFYGSKCLFKSRQELVEYAADSNARLQLETRRLSGIVEIQEHIAANGPDPDEVLRAVVQCAQMATQAEGAMVETLEGEELVFRAVSGSAADQLGRRVRFDEGLSAHCLRENRPLRCDDSRNDARVDKHICHRERIRSIVAVPFQHNRATAGVLRMVSSRPRAFTDADMATLQLMAGVVAAAMDQAIALQINQSLSQERERALRDLQRSEEQFRGVLEAAPDAMLIASADGTIRLLNAQAEALFGHSREQLIGQPVEVLLPLRSRDKHTRIRLEYAAAPETRQMGRDLEMIGLRSDGHEFPIEITLSPLDTEEGAVFIANVRDITKRVAAEEALRQSEARLAEAQKIARLGSYEYSGSSGECRWSDEMYLLFDREPEIGPLSLDELPEFYHPEDANSLRSLRMKALHSELTQESDVRIRQRDGSYRWCHSIVQSIKDSADAGPRIVGTLIDIHDRKEAENALQESKERFRSVVAAMHEGIVLQSLDEGVLLCNQRAEQILGLTRDQLMGPDSLDAMCRAIREDGTHWSKESYPVMRTLREGKSFSGVVMGMHRPNGELAWVSINSVALYQPGHSQPYAAVVTLTDITERRWFEAQIKQQMAQLNQANTAMEHQQLELKEANQQLALRQSELATANERLAGLASTDALTGLKNRRVFEEQIAKEADRSCRYGSPLSLLMLDVDHFKEFNDSFGHLAGDSVLQEVGRVLSTTARSTDFAARFGGEEFALILPETGAEAALEVAERIRLAVADSRVDGQGVTISIGVSSMAATSTAASLIAEADQALYAAKRSGRNRAMHFNHCIVELTGAAAVSQSVKGRRDLTSSDRGSRITDRV